MTAKDTLNKLIEQKLTRIAQVVEEESVDGNIIIKPDMIREILFVAHLMVIEPFTHRIKIVCVCKEPFQDIYSKYSEIRRQLDAAKDGKGIWKAMQDQKAEIEAELESKKDQVVAFIKLDAKDFESAHQVQTQTLEFRKELEKFLSLVENSAYCFERKLVDADSGRKLIQTQIKIYPTVKYRAGTPEETIELRTKVTCDRASAQTGVRIPDFYHSRHAVLDVRDIYDLVAKYQEIVTADEEELKEEQRADLMD